MNSFFKILKQIIKEYWLVLIFALGLIFFNLCFLQGSDRSIDKIINVFGQPFLLLVWLCEQYFNTLKQLKTEEESKELRKEISSLSQQLEEEKRNLTDHLTGGNSFCYWGISNITLNKGIETIVHRGEHTLFNLQARIVDMDKILLLQSTSDTINYEKILSCNIIRHYPAMVASTFIMGETFDLGNGEKRSFDIFWIASNGGFHQQLRYKKIRDKWHAATKVMRGEILLYEAIEENFPRNEEGIIDWRVPKLYQTEI